jgi:hypothetical protein
MKMLKKIILILAALCLVLCLVACDSGKGTTGDDNTDAKTDKNVGVSYFVNYNGTKITLGGAADATISALGTPQSKRKGKNCGNHGYQVEYAYTSLYIYVLETESGNTVDQIEFRDDLVSTPEGVCIGMSKADVIAKCGAASTETAVSLIYTSGKLHLSVGLDSNGTVSKIAYIREGV